MCRRIFLTIFALITGIFFILLLLYSSFLHTLNDPSFYKSILKENDAYNQIIEAAKNEVQTQISKLETDNTNSVEHNGTASESDTVTETFQKDLTQTVIDNVINEVLDPDLLQETVETNIDNIFVYLKSNDKDLKLNLPIGKIRAYIQANGNVFIERLVSEGIATLRVCTIEEEESLYPNGFVFDLNNPPDCKPTNLSDDEIKVLVLEEIPLEKQINLFIDEQGFGKLHDETTLSEIIIFFNSIPKENSKDEQPDPEKIMKSLEQVRNGYKQLVLVELVGFAIILIMLAITILINIKHKKSIPLWPSIILLGVGLATLLIGMIGKYELKQNIVQQLLSTGKIMEDKPEIIAKNTDLINTVLISIFEKPLDKLIVYSVILLVLGFILLVIFMIIRDHEQDKTLPKQTLRSKFASISKSKT